MPTIKKTFQLTRPQMQYRRSDAIYRAFVGGVGSGKSWCGAYDLIRRAQPGRQYMVAAPTYVMLRDASLRSFMAHAKDLNFLKEFRKADMVAVLGNGAEVLFRSADSPDRLRGPNLSGVWMDEASIVGKDAFDVLIGRLREDGEQGWLGATFTPKGRQQWCYEVFATGRPNTELIRSKTAQNPFLPAAFADTIRQQYTSAMAMQELEGEFTDMEGALFRRTWFAIDQMAPPPDNKAGSVVRAWDLAATTPKPGSDPDYTVGLKMQRNADGTFHIVDVRRLRGTPGQVETLIRRTAEEDGKQVHVYMEQEPGSSGVHTTDHYGRRVLAGWVFRPVRATGDKMTRALPLAAGAEMGYVKLVRGEWVKDFLDEVEVFPVGGHDDQVDAASTAYQALTSGRALQISIV
jgi:predicted phage terminase large subunit-like protein